MTPSPFLSAVHAGSVSECVKVVVSVWSCGESSGRLDCASSFGFSRLRPNSRLITSQLSDEGCPNSSKCSLQMRAPVPWI